MMILENIPNHTFLHTNSISQTKSLICSGIPRSNRAWCDKKRGGNPFHFATLQPWIYSTYDLTPGQDNPYLSSRFRRFHVDSPTHFCGKPHRDMPAKANPENDDYPRMGYDALSAPLHIETNRRFDSGFELWKERFEISCHDAFLCFSIESCCGFRYFWSGCVYSVDELLDVFLSVMDKSGYSSGRRLNVK